MAEYKKNSLSLKGSVFLGTGVMIGAGIFALLGQVAELSGEWFPVLFIIGAVISGFSAYSYIVVSKKYPSAGGVAMILSKAYGKGTITGAAALLMAFSMVMNESLVARTFGSYTAQLFPSMDASTWSPVLGVGLLVIAYTVNIAGNRVIERVSGLTTLIKVLGILLFAGAALWTAQQWPDLIPPAKTIANHGWLDYLGAAALAILAYKGFTTITNSGDEIEQPKRNVARSIIISLVVCTVVYLFVAHAVKSSLSIPEIVRAKDYSLAEAARPILGNYGMYFTVGIAIVATLSGIIASVFAVSRMTTMLTEMKLIPHSHLGMSGPIQKHMVLYIVLFAIVLTLLFDLSRIATIGAIFYLVMDIIIHWGVLRHLREDVNARPAVLITAIVLDSAVLFGLLVTKFHSDPMVFYVALGGVIAVFGLEHLYLRRVKE